MRNGSSRRGRDSGSLRISAGIRSFWVSQSGTAASRDLTSRFTGSPYFTQAGSASNYGEIRGWVGGARRRWNALVDAVALGPLAGVKRWLANVLTGRAGVFVFIGLSALVYGFLSPSFGLDANSAALFMGLLVGLGLITAAFDLPLRLYHGPLRRSAPWDCGFPAQTASRAVMLMLAPARRFTMSATAPGRSAPSIRKPCFFSLRVIPASRAVS